MKRLVVGAAILLVVLVLGGCEVPTLPAVDMAASEVDSGSIIVDRLPAYPPFPIHVTYLDDDWPDIFTAEVDRAVEHWSELLAPTPRMPYTLDGPRYISNRDTLVAGTTLAEGLHIWIVKDTAIGIAAATPLRPNADGATPPAGYVLVDPDFIVRVEDAMRRSPSIADSNLGRLEYAMLHEIGHVVGIGGIGDRWESHFELTPLVGDIGDVDRFTYRNPAAVAALERMDVRARYPHQYGTAHDGLPFPGYPIPLPYRTLGGFHHWGSCTGVVDVMSALGNLGLPGEPRKRLIHVVSEVTLNAMAARYRYDPAAVRGSRIDPSRWNTDTITFTPTAGPNKGVTIARWCQDGVRREAIVSARGDVVSGAAVGNVNFLLVDDVVLPPGN